MGLIVMMYSFQVFDPLSSWLVAWTNINFVNYDSFTPTWYLDIGEKICFYVFLSSLITNILNLLSYFRVFLIRFYDRRFKMNVKKDPEDEEDDEPNTRKKS